MSWNYRVPKIRKNRSVRTPGLRMRFCSLGRPPVFLNTKSQMFPFTKSFLFKKKDTLKLLVIQNLSVWLPNEPPEPVPPGSRCVCRFDGFTVQECERFDEIFAEHSKADGEMARRVWGAKKQKIREPEKRITAVDRYGITLLELN